MADIDFKNSVNVDTAYVDGHKVKLIAVPDGSLELPISANDEYGYVVDANGKKHRVLLVTFLEGEPDYKQSPTADTAYITVNSQKVKVRLGAKLNGTQYLSDSANVNDCYTEDDDSNKHRTILVSEPTGTLELPTSEISDSAYVIDNDGNKHKVRLFAVLAGGTTIVEVTVSGVPPLNLLGAVEDSLSSVKAYGGLLQGGVPTPSDPMDIVCNNGALKILDKSAWTIFTNPTSIAGQGVWIDTTGMWKAVNDNGAGCAIPLTIGKQYTLVIHKKTTGLGTILRYGQSPQATPTSAGVQLTDWYRGDITDGQIVSFVAKQPYLVMQLSAVAVEAGMVQEAIEVLEAQGDNETLKLTPSNDTAGVANLLKIDNYVDTQEILTGLINHQLGILVLNGLETYNVQYSFYIHSDSCDAFISVNDVKSMSAQDAIGACTHLKLEKGAIWSGSGYPNTFTFNTSQLHLNFAHDVIGTTSSSTTEEASAAIKSYIAAQYAAGTPVIIVYPLATAQDEVAPIPQTMQTVAGDNTLDIVQAGMSGLEVSATYMKGVSVTITEIEDANIGNSVEVVIA